MLKVGLILGAASQGLGLSLGVAAAASDSLLGGSLQETEHIPGESVP